MKDALRILKALSDETRLRMLMLVEQEELCVCEIMQILDMGQSRVSRHLNILKNAGLLDARRRGTWMFYRPVWDESSKHCGRIMEALRDWIEDNDLVKADLAKVNGCLAGRDENGCCSVSDVL